MALPEISFIIPTYNEEHGLPRVIENIRQHADDSLDFEVIVVDHGSIDATVSFARQLGARVYVQPTGTIGGLRNLGVRYAKGAILAFIDADVLLTEDWAKEIPKTLESLRKDENVLTGSWYDIPDHPSWIERFWFKPLTHGKNTHINSGHLIVTRTVFERLGGFSEELETGEDYEFSMRARANSVRIFDNPALRVIHEGYPKTLRNFMRREVWHGKGDYKSLRTIARSKVALASLAFMFLHVFLLFSLVWRLHNAVIGMAVFLIILLVTSASWAKYRGQPIHFILVNSVLFYFYFWSRVLAFCGAVIRPHTMKKDRKRYESIKRD